VSDCAKLHTPLECVSKLPLQVAPGDEGAAEREEGFVDVRAAFVAQREAAEAMQPGQGAFDNPADDAEAAAMRTAGLGHHRHDALRGQSRVAGARPVDVIALHGAGLTARAPGSAGHGGQRGDERLELQNVGHVGGGHGPRCRRDSRRPTRARPQHV
jgi:hypothetical protein